MMQVFLNLSFGLNTLIILFLTEITFLNDDFLDRSNLGDQSDVSSVNSDLFHQICDMDELYGQQSYNVVDVDISDNDANENNDSDDDSSVNSDLFLKVCEFDSLFGFEMMSPQESTPKRKNEEDISSSPSKSPRISSSDTLENPDTP